MSTSPARAPPVHLPSAFSALCEYWHGLVLCLHLGRPYAALAAAYPALPAEARLQIYSLCLHLRLWSLPHYRSGTFANDMRKNLRNVALPGTGVPISLLCSNYFGAVIFLWIGVPLAALVAAIVRLRGVPARGAASVSLGRAFAEALLASGSGGRTWFHYWRLNTALASYHALKTSDDGYALEDKLAFLQAGEREGVSVSPWLRHPRLVVKHRNEEGGLGLHTFENADVRVQHGARHTPTLRPGTYSLGTYSLGTVCGLRAPLSHPSPTSPPAYRPGAIGSSRSGWTTPRASPASSPPTPPSRLCASSLLPKRVRSLYAPLGLGPRPLPLYTVCMCASLRATALVSLLMRIGQRAV